MPFKNNNHKILILKLQYALKLIILKFQSVYKISLTFNNPILFQPPENFLIGGEISNLSTNSDY